MADLQVYLDRLIAIANALPDMTASDAYPDEKTVYLSQSLPFAFIDEGEATYEKVNSDTWRVTREFLSEVYVQAFIENTEQENAARAAARALLPIYAGQFMKRHRLQLNDAGLNSLNSAGITADSGPIVLPRKQILHIGLYVRHFVIYDEQISEE